MEVSYGVKCLRQALENQAGSGATEFSLGFEDMEAIVGECEDEVRCVARRSRYAVEVDGENMVFNIKCSTCGHDFLNPSYYCPDCGARMEG